jgi:hypothetical protein
VGFIKADPAECFKVVRKYYQYVQLMPNVDNPAAGKYWLQPAAFRLGGHKTMEEGTQEIRKALRPNE